MSEQPEAFRCSFVDLENDNRPCEAPAKWACRIDVGPWMLGWWGCDIHKPYLETLLPVLSTPKGPRVIPVAGVMLRSPLILSLDYLATGQQGNIPPAFKCDICDRPIIRDYKNNIWVHTESDAPRNHQARVG